VGHKGAMEQIMLQCKKHIKMKKGQKLEKAISIEKPSPTTCLKIEAT
jgi:hypothetical protein